MNNYDPLVKQLLALTVENVPREFPNYIAHSMQSVDDVFRRPRELHPAFYGCLDWHSAVHSHWQMVRALRLFPTASFVDEVMTILTRHLSAENLQTELAYLQARPGYERPYGLAWLLQLCAELREWQTPQALRWLDNLQPLESLSAERITNWLPKLSYPVRTGSHSQTAFSLGLVYDWAQVALRTDVVTAIRSAALRFYQADMNAPLTYEPSGTDFLSPALGEADLMRRVLSNEAFAAWLITFLPLTAIQSLAPVTISDANDGQLAHFGGLNLSRAWMLQGIAQALPEGDERSGVLLASAEIHQTAGLQDATNPAYMMSHWIPTFAIYLITQRGL